MFRFAIFGAGAIAVRFCDAVSLMDEALVCSVASKSLDRAQRFAEKQHLPSAYGSYEELLAREHPDCVYIATTNQDHFRLTMLCLAAGIPVLCEKAMFESALQAREAIRKAREHQVFWMEGLWSRFLPAICKAREWLEAGRIGTPSVGSCTIGFVAPKDDLNRYYSPLLGGGCAKDVTVYAYELSTYLFRRQPDAHVVQAVFSPSGVDIANQLTLRFGSFLMSLTTTFTAAPEEKLMLWGDLGAICVPHPHYASSATLLDLRGQVVEHFEDTQTRNGFTYELEEARRCIRSGLLESPVVPWAETLAFAEVIDEIHDRQHGI